MSAYPPPPLSTPSPYVYRPVGGLTTAVVALLAAYVLTSVLSAITLAIELASPPEPLDELTPLAMAQIGVCCLNLPIYIATIVVFCIWIHRANANAHALGAAEMDFTPGWAVGWWFIPFMNLFKPFQATREIWKASDPDTPPQLPTAWQNAAAPSILGLWWALWIVGNIVGNISLRLGLRDDPQLVRASSWFGVVSDVLIIGAAVLAILIVRGIQARQEAKASRFGARTERCPACGYDVRGNSLAQVCPECGTRLPSQPITASLYR